MNTNPHAGGPVIWRGTPLNQARAALILLHGRGASAGDIVQLGEALRVEGLAIAAPQARGSIWYPERYIVPKAQNEPYLTSALERIETLIAEIEAAGIPREKIALGGFSQGACLTATFLATHPAKYLAGLIFTGAAIRDNVSEFAHAAGLAGTPVLLTGSDVDPHIAWDRAEETAQVLQAAGAEVMLQQYAGRPHTVSFAEVESASTMVREALQ